MSNLVTFGRHTITGMLVTAGLQFSDWTADYRLFSQDRINLDAIFSVCRRDVLISTPNTMPFVVAMDDSIFRKRGKKTHGVAFRRDPLGPPFRVNLIRGQRFLQLSAALPSGQNPGPARMIPIDFRHCPTAAKPRKNAPPEEWKKYRQIQKEQNISLIGVGRIKALRESLDRETQSKNRPLVVSVDGGYTNSTVLKALPPRTILIGRIRKDAKLYYLPKPIIDGKKGRKRVYGEQAPTPEELRQNKDIPFQRITAWATGKQHEFKVKTIESLKWRTAGGNHILRLMIIAPLGYRLSKGAPILYRKPAYLICTDPDLTRQDILQYYLWRWDIEVNFRDEKHLLGAGQAQVRHEQSVEKVPGLIIASYAMLLLAAEKTFATDNQNDFTLPTPKWIKEEKEQRASTPKIIKHLRAELWSQSLGIKNFSDFENNHSFEAKPEKINPNLSSAVLYAAA